MTERFPQIRMTPVYGLFHYILRGLYDACFRGEVIGLENLPAGQGFIIAANHASHLDPPLIGSNIPRQMCFFARKTLWKPGLASKWLDAVGTIPVDRDGGSDIQAMKRVLRALSEGKVIILFPEGTRSPTGELQTPKAGVGFMSCRTASVVVPVRIFGSFTAFGRSGPMRLGTPVDIVIGKPIAPADYDDPKDGKERYQRASERIMTHIAALRPPVDPVV